VEVKGGRGKEGHEKHTSKLKGRDPSRTRRRGMMNSDNMVVNRDSDDLVV
jgi:hypothetical protein